MKIYLASSWRNPQQPLVVGQLRSEGYDVYDFRNPAPGNQGFAWSSIDPDWLGWTPELFRRALKHPIADKGFRYDKDAIDACDVCVLLLPCGRSAHLELGYAVGQGKYGVVLCPAETPTEPELMYRLADRVVLSVDELIGYLRHLSFMPGMAG